MLWFCDNYSLQQLPEQMLRATVFTVNICTKFACALQIYNCLLHMAALQQYLHQCSFSKGNTGHCSQGNLPENFGGLTHSRIAVLQP